MPVHVTSIRRYPVKSCRGEELPAADVEPWGLAGDRRWMIVDPAGEVLTAREVHRLLLVHPEITADGLRLSAPGRTPLDVARPDGSALLDVDIWGDRLPASPSGAEADAWISGAAERPARLVYLDDPTRRRTDPTRTEPEDRVSFADGFPVLLTTEESLAELNELISAGPLSAQGPLPMTRFRPNVVVSGAAPWAEDSWRRLRIGPVWFRMVKSCDRCVMTTLDPDTALGGKEPIATLARHRRAGGRTWFGVNLVPDAQGGRIGIGDEVDIVSAADPGEGPLR